MKWLTDVSQTFARCGRDIGLLYAIDKSYAKKSCRYLLSLEHNARKCQTDRQTTER